MRWVNSKYLDALLFSLFQNGLYPVDGPTIVYMPHCDMELYENLLRANWKPHIDALKLLFIANQLSDYIDKWVTLINLRVPGWLSYNSNPLQMLKDKAPYLVDVGVWNGCCPTYHYNHNIHAVPLLQHCALPVSKTWPTAFNNIAVQFIPTKYPQVVISTWIERFIPLYLMRPMWNG